MAESALRALGCRHPLGLGAGPDRGGGGLDQAMDAGFSFVELGTVTPRAEPQHNPGAAALAACIAQRAPNPGCIIGVSIGAQFATPPKDIAADWRDAMSRVAAVARFVTINLSAPYYAPLLCHETIGILTAALATAAGARERPGTLPLLVKLPFGGAQGDEVVKLLLPRLASCGIGAIVVSSAAATVVSAVAHIVAARVGSGLPVVASGGVRTAADLHSRLEAGAELVQVYTAFVDCGPAAVRELIAAAGSRRPAPHAASESGIAAAYRELA